MSDPSAADRSFENGRQHYDAELQRMLAADTRGSMGTFLIADVVRRREAERTSDPGVAAATRGLVRRDVAVDGPVGPVALSVLRRGRGHPDEPLPAVYFIHGGGMMVGDRFTGIEAVLDWVRDLGMVCVTVDYRLAPEHPDPVPVEDCCAGLEWVLRNAHGLGIDPDRVIVCGVSAGGGLAAGTMLLMRDRRGAEVLGQMLVGPMLDDRNDSASARRFAENEFWDRRSNETGWTALLGERSGGTAVSTYAAPGRATELSGLPPTYLDVGSAELFRDEGIAFASSLLTAGVPVELHVWQGGFHEFDAIYPSAALSIACRAARTAWVRRALESPPAGSR